jgi:type II secretory pathway predicted ATPase ExeA
MVALGVIPALPREVLAERDAVLARKGASPWTQWYWRKKAEALQAKLGRGADQEVKEVPMLTAPMLRYFGFTRNPVFDEIKHPRDVWWGSQHKEAKAVLIEAAEQARFIRLAGRRGAGKSLVAAAVEQELKQRDDITLVQPSAVITHGLSELDLVSAVIQAIKRKTDAKDEVFPEAQNRVKRALAMRYLLIQQRRQNRQVVVWIDEAHELRAATYLSLKRFLDEVDGLGRRLLGIVLIGQDPEAAYNPRTRDLSEVTLRLQTYRLQPMNQEIPDYLRHKIQRAEGSIGDVITPAALKAIGTRCAFPLDANVLFAQLLIEAYDNKKKPIGREHVEEAMPAEETEEVAG